MLLAAPFLGMLLRLVRVSDRDGIEPILNGYTGR